jgi:hypothetical protein
MNNQIRQWLLLTISLLLLARTAAAQSAPLIRKSDKQSHHDLPGVLDPASAQQMMSQRLQELRQMQQMQAQVRELLQNRAFLDRIKNQMSGDDLRQWRDKLATGKGLAPDDWNRLLRQSGPHAKLDPRHIDALRNFIERMENKLPARDEFGNVRTDPDPPPSTPASPFGDGTGIHPLPPPVPPSAAPQPSLLERMQEDTTSWLVENPDIMGDVIEAITKIGRGEDGAPLAELLRSVRLNDFSGIGASEPAQELSRHFSDVAGFFQRHGGEWIEAHADIYAKLPSLPRLHAPTVSVSPSAAADSDGWAPALLSVLMLGAFVLFLCKWGIVAPAQRGEGEEWRLGSWPVSPGGVSTRQDVVRAFEHLVLLRLGPAADACHHLDLAARLAAQDSGNSARRQAAEMLAGLYEQARYAPAEEALSEGQLTDARHALCFLAGVKGA